MPVSRSYRRAQKKEREELARKAETKGKRRSKKTSTKKEKQDGGEKEKG